MGEVVYLPASIDTVVNEYSSIADNSTWIWIRVSIFLTTLLFSFPVEAQLLISLYSIHNRPIYEKRVISHKYAMVNFYNWIG